MKYISVYFVLIHVLLSCNSKQTVENVKSTNSSFISVSENNHYLQTADGKPFFYLGDTAWELFHRLTREEAETYLEDRKLKGFNVIQAVVLPERGAFNSPNIYKDQPLISVNGNYLPNTTAGESFGDSTAYDYYDHVEYIINLAEQKGLYVGLLPCWGDYVTPRFRSFIVLDDTAKGYNYGQFIGNRFKSHKNIIWILGGDRLPNENNTGISVWRAMAEGIADAANGEVIPNGKADYSSTCMSYHCFYPSSIWFEKDAWIDFHIWGSYHEKQDNDRAFEIPYYQWQLENMKPTINAEPAYEMSGINYDENGKNGFFDDFDIRQQAYWSVFAGAMGHTYGCDLIWKFYNIKYSKPRKSLKITSWVNQLNCKGANQMKYLKQLIESKPFFERIPAQDILARNEHDATGHLQATKGKNYAFVYIPTGKKIQIVMGKIEGEKVKASWFNPKSGNRTTIGTYSNNGIASFDPPGDIERGNDWVLVLETM